MTAHTDTIPFMAAVHCPAPDCFWTGPVPASFDGERYVVERTAAAATLSVHVHRDHPGATRV